MRNKFTPVKTAKRRKKSSTQWLSRQLNDPYVKQAKELGYRSRAAFKLIQINDKFNFLKKGKLVIDLGSAPGGWSQVLVEKVGAGNVLAVDILEMAEIPGVKFIQQDFLAENADQIIIDAAKTYLKKNRKFDIILSDMAANSCGDAKTDHLRIIEMLELNLDFATKILAKDGCFIGKVFQGGASAELLKKFQQNFNIVKHFKPDSSRKESAENYIIALGFK
jgi:23S rRNA (uridine2552-2'-O)-methyltransferase